MVNQNEVFKLLKSKSRCLKKLFDLSQGLLAEVQLGNYADLDQFHLRRNAVLKAVQLYDRKVTDSLQQIYSLGTFGKIPQFDDTFKNLVQEQENEIKRILDSDRQIILKIEAEKDQLAKELMSTEKKNHMFQRFKSKWVSESGEKLDGKI